MQNLKYIFSVLVLTMVLFSCKNETQPETKTVEIETTTTEKILNPDAEYISASFEIEGMKCAMGCAKVIEKNIAKMDGVKEVAVDFDTKTATVSYDEEFVDQEKLTATVKNTSDTYSVTSWNGDIVPVTEENIQE
ncbi:MAG: heavy metal-associated domain-containing protein [Flavobacteriaceae bacterium]